MMREISAPATDTPESAANRLRGKLSKYSGTITSAALKNATKSIQRTDQARFRMDFQSACSCSMGFDPVFKSLNFAIDRVINLHHLDQLTLNSVELEREYL